MSTPIDPNLSQVKKPHITGPLWGETTGHRWIPLAKGQLCGNLIKGTFTGRTTRQAQPQNKHRHLIKRVYFHPSWPWWYPLQRYISLCFNMFTFLHITSILPALKHLVLLAITWWAIASTQQRTTIRRPSPDIFTFFFVVFTSKPTEKVRYNTPVWR